MNRKKIKKRRKSRTNLNQSLSLKMIKRRSKMKRTSSRLVSQRTISISLRMNKGTKWVSNTYKSQKANVRPSGKNN